MLQTNLIAVSRRLSTIVSIFLFFVLTVQCDKDDDVSGTTVTPNDFLAAKKYDKLTVEIQFVKGFAPTAGAVTNLENFLAQRLNKPAGITIVQNEISSPGKASYAQADIRDVESSSRTQKTNGKTLTAYFFFADADYGANSGNGKVLGIAYGSSSMAIFGKTLREYSGGISQPSLATIETTVMLHEFSHILGLVNNGTTMQGSHQDQPHGKHCNDENCLMYYTAETSDVVANIVGGNIPALDSNCINDLKANGGK
jgi:predicted Zn-dependent protease